MRRFRVAGGWLQALARAKMGDNVVAWWLSRLGDWSGVLPVAGCQVVVDRGHGLPIPELLLVEMLWRSHRVATWARSWSDLSSG